MERDAAALRESIGRTGGDVTAAHVAYLAGQRGWPVLSDRPNQLFASEPSLLIEPV